MDDQVIIDWYWERSEYAIVATKKKYGSYCHRVSYNILQNHEDTEECLNDLYMKAWESIPPTRPLRLGAYLTKIVRNLALQRYKKNHAKKRGGGEVPLVYEELEHVLTESMKDEDLVDVLNEFLADLPRLTRVMFMQRYFYLHSIQEIATTHQLGESHVKMTLKRTRDALQRALEAEGVRV